MLTRLKVCTRELDEPLSIQVRFRAKISRARRRDWVGKYQILSVCAREALGYLDYRGRF